MVGLNEKSPSQHALGEGGSRPQPAGKTNNARPQTRKPLNTSRTPAGGVKQGPARPSAGAQTPRSRLPTAGRGPSTPARGMSTPAREMSTPARGLSTPARGLSTPARGMSNSSRNLSNSTRNLSNSTRNLSNTGSRGLANSVRSLSTSTKTLPNSTKGVTSSAKLKKTPVTAATGGKGKAAKAGTLGLGEEDKEIMDLTRRPKDKNFKHVFKGSVLVTTLLEYNNDRFDGREGATGFAQRLLEAGHVQSVVGSRSFDDSAALYRWGDESVVKEARKMVVATTSSHIPKRRLIEMMDLHQGAGEVDAYRVSEVKDKFTSPPPPAAQKEDDRKVTSPPASGGDVSRRRAAERRYSDQTAQRPRACANSGDVDTRPSRGVKTRSSSIDGTLDRASPRHLASPAESTGSTRHTPSRHAPSPAGSSSSGFGQAVGTGGSTPRSPMNPSPVTFAPKVAAPPASAPPMSEPITFTVQMDRHATPSRPASSSQVTPIMMTSSGPTHTEVLSPTPIHIHTEVFVPVMTTRFEPTFHTPARTFDTPVSSVQQSYDRGRQESAPPSPNRSPPPPEQHPREAASPGDGTPLGTCRYDGIDMPALDIDSIDFRFPRVPVPAAALPGGGDALEQSMAELEGEGNCYSDNEKQLLEQMRRMRAEHETVLQTYEGQINKLMGRIEDLREVAEVLETRQGAEEEAPPPEEVSPDVPAAPPPPPIPHVPAAPPPPLPPVNGPPPPSLVQPSKPPVKPRVKMRPLFWSRVILEPAAGEKSSFWHRATEPNFDVAEFERLFGRQVETNNNNPKSLHDAMTPHKNTSKQQAVKLLEDNRSRAVGIKMRSMHCHLADIRGALYRLDFSRVDLDSLQGVYDIRASAEELEKITGHLHERPDDILDQPEQFLLEISQMAHFTLRIECLCFIKRFKETLFNIDERLTTVQQACDDVMGSDPLRTVLESVLSFGNYMNGGTQRGQADGFDLSILPKLKDVKSMDTGTNLLHYIAGVRCREQGEAVGRGGASCGLPDPGLAAQAAGVSLSEMDGELRGLRNHLETHGAKASEVASNSTEEHLQPFKDRMDDFLESAEHMLKDQQDKYTETAAKFEHVVTYYTGKPLTDQVTLEAVFRIWAAFFTDYRTFWKEEQKRIARAMFEKVDQKRKERLKMSKRRKSVATASASVEAPNKNLKLRFAQLRRRSEAAGPTFRLMRSTSVSSLDVPGDGKRAESPDVLDPGGVGGYHGSRESLHPVHTRAKSDSERYPVYQDGTPPPALPATPPPGGDSPCPASPATPNSYRREVSLPPSPAPSDQPDPLDSVFERMERRRRRGVVVLDPPEQEPPPPPHAASHPLHERIRRRRSRAPGEPDPPPALRSMGSLGSLDLLPTGPQAEALTGAPFYPDYPSHDQDPPRRKLSDLRSRLSSRPQWRVTTPAQGSEADRKPPRTLPSPPVTPSRESQAGDYIGSYNVRAASEQREKALRDQEGGAPHRAGGLSDPASPPRESRCSSPSSTTSSHSSLDSARPLRMPSMPRMRERAVSVERDLGTLSEQEYRDALRRSARARASSVNSLR